MTPDLPTLLAAVPTHQIGAAITLLSARLLAAPVEPADELLTPDETARLLKTTRKVIYNHAGALGAVRIGRTLRFDRARVLRYLERRRR